MMRIHIIFIIVFFLFSNIIFSQNKDLANPHFLKKNQFEIELNYLSIAGYYNRKIANRFSIGTGFGFGRGTLGFFILEPNTYPRVLGDYLHLNLLGSYYYSKNIKLELGVKSALAMFGENDFCEECGTFYTSGFFSILFGLKHFKLGTRLCMTKIKIGNSNSNFVLIFNPVFFRLIF